ncbi:hypothetical protein MNEG_9290 [Monoraphidium neglectum]|uniref:valine--tRNA ligase n=1 Tax=Monoraphidium neglectum TaxID=145388 RepID=A0A0D2MD38_9CHLO|nr:hypothetical protein MNEG_9290 [Monoraphidium neglectum]KIY98671.1 hypothetical protein MNEG_9290 [Monoraphidium neglectum]|eukprot:XP_013897691.1 hypothetical protein MNEG_9290 [Monoraphidium neglectum]
MATFQAPPGHLSQAEVLILSRMVEAKLTVEAPDPDLQAPQLTTAEGHKVVGTMAVVRAVAASGDSKGDALVPKDLAGEVDRWLEVAAELESHAGAWLEPTSHHTTDEAREASRPDILAHLGAVEAQLSRAAADAAAPAASLLGAGGGPLTLADVAVACALLPLWRGVLGEDVRAGFPATGAWLRGAAESEHFAPVVGEVKFCAASGWAEPAAAPADKKKKKKKGAAAGATEGGEQQQQQQDDEGGEGGGDKEELDPEKAAKKAAKLAEKEAKRAKAAAKAAAAAAAADKAGGGNDKKAKAKAEADAKKARCKGRNVCAVRVAAAEAEEVAKLLAEVRSTPKGERKIMPAELYKGYHPTMVEAAWYEWWEQCGFFKPDLASDKPPFVIVIPPPNVTGALHIGHALTNSIQDTIVRWRRMSGYNVLWVPGMDHAGIATQSVVEKKLAKERRITRHDLGRDAFLTEVYSWVKDYGGRICGQLRRMGSSVDWSRQVFTMDDARSASVLEAFVRMYEGGVIYRDNRLVNWDCRLRTAVSDIEVDYIDVPGRTLINVPGFDQPVEFGVLTSFAYPLESGEGEIVVATTRPETMLGDTAVAVHPEDPRWGVGPGVMAMWG